MAEVMDSSSSSKFAGLLISNLVFTKTELGRGSDATVYEVDWNGTPCAAKRLHKILVEDMSSGGTGEKLLNNFEAECITWSRLRHPGIVQFLGVYLERRSRLPVLVMEKMDTSLRKYLEDHSKEEFPLQLKAFVLRQVSQALAYIHSQKPPLVHHDLSTNNVLLNVVSFMTKLTDFGMSRAINPSAISRKSSVKGTPAFMPPEAFQNHPHYNEKLDVFSFGNIILSTVTHEWPEPCHATLHKGGWLIALDEFQRREHYTKMFTVQEKQFLPTACRCLENLPDKRPSSLMLVQELRCIESSLQKGERFAAPTEQLQQQLAVIKEECRQKDVTIQKASELLKEKDGTLRRNGVALRKKDEALVENDIALRAKGEVLRKKDATIQAQQDTIQKLQSSNQAQRTAIQAQHATNQTQCTAIRKQQDTIQAQRIEIEWLKNELAITQELLPKVRHPPRDWRKLDECQKVIRHRPQGGAYFAVAVNREGFLAVTEGGNGYIHLLTQDNKLVRSVGEGVLGGSLLGVAFDLKGNIWVADCGRNKAVKLFPNGRLLNAVYHTGSQKDYFRKPCSMAVSPEGLVYICDYDSHRVTVHDEEGQFLFAFGSKGNGLGRFDTPYDLAFGSDGFVYVTDEGNKRICVWSREGTFKRIFKTKCAPTCIAATSDSHLLITSHSSYMVMVYTLEGELVHQFGAKGSHPGEFNRCWGICIDNSGLVYVADCLNRHVQVF